ncbi:MAG: tRNA pseudouridine(55) synthase TruB [Thermodesulfobacteriota bacterium]
MTDMLPGMEPGGVPAPVSAGEAMAAEGGIFLVDKPVGPTSFAMVQRLRRALNIKKVGHAGTLDPFASGLLILCAGRPATKIIDQLVAGDKEYRATLQLGAETDTQDLEGRVVAEQPVVGMDDRRIAQVLLQFTGDLMQAPPAYSAVKHQGKPLYAYARKGIVIKKEPRPVRVESLIAEAYDAAAHRLTIRVVCSKGTYIRTLAADIGQALGCGAHLVALRRLRSGPFRVETAVDGALLADREAAAVLLAGHRLTVAAVLAQTAAWPGSAFLPQSA